MRSAIELDKLRRGVGSAHVGQCSDSLKQVESRESRLVSLIKIKGVAHFSSNAIRIAHMRALSTYPNAVIHARLAAGFCAKITELRSFQTTAGAARGAGQMNLF